MVKESQFALLEQELSKFKRSIVTIIDLLNSQLGVQLVPYLNRARVRGIVSDKMRDIISEFDANGIGSILQDLIFWADLGNNTELMVSLPIPVELYMQDLSNDTNLSCLVSKQTPMDTIHHEFRDSMHKKDRRILLELTYDDIIFWDTYSYTRGTFKFSQLGAITMFFSNTLDSSLISLIEKCNIEICLTEYLLNRDLYYRKLISSLVNTAVNTPDVARDIVDDDIQLLRQYRDNQCKDELATICFCELSGKHDFKDYTELITFDSNVHRTCLNISRSVILDRWKNLLSDSQSYDITYVEYNGCVELYDDEFTSSFQESFRDYYGVSPFRLLSINTAKDLAKLFTKVCLGTNNITASVLLSKVPKYISADETQFKRSYNVYNNALFCDGNLSKERAVKKFIEAVEIMGLNLSSFTVDIKYLK